MRFIQMTLRLLLLSAGMMLWGSSSNSLAAAVQAGESAEQLKIVDVLFEDYDGWPSPRLQIKAGGEAVLNFRIEGFQRHEGRDAADFPEYRVSLQYEVELRDPKGVLVAPTKEEQIQHILGLRDDTWRPLVRWSEVIPTWAPTGTYPIRILVKDEIGDQQGEYSINLQVRGEALPAADTFQIERLEFARSLDGPWTPSRYFARSDPVYVHFKVVGYRISPDKRIWVQQDWTVLDEQGREVIHRENAVEDQLQEFYPPRYLTTSFQVQLDDPQPGAYTLQIALRDRIGDQIYSKEAVFNLRP